MAALSLGKHPWSLNDERSTAHLDSWYTWEFWERRDVFMRAAETGLIDWQCPPNTALEYMKQRGIGFEPDLEEIVGRFHPVVNWEEAFDSVLRWAKENQAEHQRQLAHHLAALESAQRDSLDAAAWQDKALALIEDLTAENQEVSARLEQMESTVAFPAATEVRSSRSLKPFLIESEK
jgi:hypothetical protein